MKSFKNVPMLFGRKNGQEAGGQHRSHRHGEAGTAGDRSGSRDGGRDRGNERGGRDHGPPAGGQEAYPGSRRRDPYAGRPDENQPGEGGHGGNDGNRVPHPPFFLDPRAGEKGG